jgi:transcriptional regulator with XRE-family HTH domain
MRNLWRVMPRRSKFEKEPNPLRLLREALSPGGIRHPISMNELSKITGVPFDTVKAIEAGRRSLRGGVLEQVAEETGAHWNGRKRRWEAYEGLETVPFTRDRFLEHRQGLEQRPEHPEHWEAQPLVWFAMMFEEVSDKDWRRLLSRLEFLYEQCRRDFKLKGIDSNSDVEVSRTMKLMGQVEDLLVQFRSRKGA